MPLPVRPLHVRPLAVWLGTTLGEEFGPVWSRLCAGLDVRVEADVEEVLSACCRVGWPSRILPAGTGTSPPRLFPGMKTLGFRGRSAPGTSTCSRLSLHGLRAPLDPAVVVLAIDVAARFAAADVTRLVARWPLATLLGVRSSLADGRRRGGPPLPGIREVPWHEAAILIDRWTADWESGRAGWAALPRTADREEELSAEVTGIGPGSPGGGDRASGISPAGMRVAVAASARDGAGPVADLVRAAGYPPVAVITGPPPAGVAADVVVWDVAGDARSILPVVRTVAALRPALGLVLLESFPRGDVAAEALHAGAACILGRPVPLAALAGALDALRARRGSPTAGLEQPPEAATVPPPRTVPGPRRRRPRPESERRGRDTRRPCS
jgi:hypothetical protein